MVTESRARALRVGPQGLGDASPRPRAAARGGEGGWGGAIGSYHNQNTPITTKKNTTITTKDLDGAETTHITTKTLLSQPEHCYHNQNLALLA